MVVNTLAERESFGYIHEDGKRVLLAFTNTRTALRPRHVCCTHILKNQVTSLFHHGYEARKWIMISRGHRINKAMFVGEVDVATAVGVAAGVLRGRLVEGGQCARGQPLRYLSTSGCFF